MQEEEEAEKVIYLPCEYIWTAFDLSNKKEREE